jgi:hypothetical protein
MIRFAFALLVCAALVASPRIVLAQGATPQPTPSDWMAYDDPAMHFRAPVGFQPIGQRQIPVTKLGDDPMVVAGWIYPQKDHLRRLVIQQEYFQGDVHAFQSEYEGQLRDQYDTPLFKDKQNLALKNGMPAIFEVMTTGEGFNVQKFYMLLWADGQRGVVILLNAPVNDLNDADALRIVSDASAVRYPVGRGDL